VRWTVGAAAVLLITAAATAQDETAIEGKTTDIDAEMIRIEGAIEAGWRLVGDRSGRFDQDVNLDDGPRLFNARFDLHSLEDNGGIDHIRFRADGVGDPARHFELRLRRMNALDLRITRDRDEYSYRATYDANPFDSERVRTNVRLSLRPTDGLTVHFGGSRVERDGDARLQRLVFGEQSIPVEAPLDDDHNTYTVGLDARSGEVRFGVHQAWAKGDSVLLRTLSQPDTPVDDLGVYRTDTDLDSSTTSGYVGMTMAGGALDLEVRGAYLGSRSKSQLFGREQVSSDGGDGVDPSPDDFGVSTENHGSSRATLHGTRLTALATVKPTDPVEVLLRYERDAARERSSFRSEERILIPPFSAPADPFFTTTEDLRTRTVLERFGGDVTWRPHKAWRVRGGGEHVKEEVTEVGGFSPPLSPKTTLATLGVDTRVYDDLDVSVLGRTASTGGAATQLSADTGDMLSVRVRARPLEGWHGTAWWRVDEREEDDAHSEVDSDAFGLSGGIEADTGWMEASVSRHRFTVASDTRYVVDRIVDPVKSPHRVRYDEEVDVVSLDFSREISGPLRGFGSLSWANARGDLPSTSRDASLGLGWRFEENLELKVEGRMVAYRERNRSVDDYDAEILTISVVWTF
jgi:hypothetical protein